MGTFAVEVTAKNLQDPRRHRTLSFLVDTGATYTTLPRDVVDELGCRPIGRRRGTFRRPAPLPRKHTAEVLAELGLARAEIERPVATKVVRLP
ncbi:MAG: aspartyl protease family protein [Candidatus Rokubacteria bacterium]|nr:aspartyl protease family protein [Candidatus Rokubacteria bacterium]